VMRGGNRVAWTNAVTFNQSPDGNSTAPCSTAPVAESPAPAQASVPTAASTQGSSPGMLLSALGLLALLLLVAALLWRRRAPTLPPVEAQPPAPPPPAPPPESEPLSSPTPAPWVDPLKRLPETHLVLRKGPVGMERFYRVHTSPFHIGYSKEMNLVVDLPQITAHHATLQVYPNGNVFVVDAGSKNGTFVDGQRLAQGTRVLVKPGQIISLSRHLELELEQPGLAPKAASAPGPTTSPPPTPPAPPAPSVPSDAPAASTRPKVKTIFAPMKPPGEGEK